MYEQSLLVSSAFNIDYCDHFF